MGIGYGNVIFCNGCGAPLSFEDGKYSVECEYCKVKNTRPTLITPEKQEEYEQAVSLRKQGEFDKAATIFSKLIADFGTVSEFYWEMLMCNYGIIFVEDPNSPKRNIPTMVKKKDTFIIDDSDYRSAIKYAPDDAKEAYREIAGIIDDYQRKYFELQSEKPYDVFISYKVQDSETKEKTEDSKIAYEIYRTLNKAGYRVFLSEVSLASKMGEEYEPHIFNALTSAKVLIVVGTKKEYVESTWVKNEWNRFLMLMRTSDDIKRTIIPVYRDADPYELPRELYAKQAVNAGTLGFETDILKYIDKFVAPENDSHVLENMKKQIENMKRGGDPNELLKDAEAMMNNEVYNEELFKLINKVLEIDPNNSKAYWYRALATNKCNTKNIESSYVDVSGSPDVLSAMRLGTSEEKQYYTHVIDKCHKNINLRNEYHEKVSELREKYLLSGSNTPLHKRKAELEKKSAQYYKYSDEKSEPKKTLVNNIINLVGIILVILSLVVSKSEIYALFDFEAEVSNESILRLHSDFKITLIILLVSGILNSIETMKITYNRVAQMICSILLPLLAFVVNIFLSFDVNGAVAKSEQANTLMWIMLFHSVYICYFVISGVANIIKRINKEKKVKMFECDKEEYCSVMDDIAKNFDDELTGINNRFKEKAEELKSKIDYAIPLFFKEACYEAKETFGRCSNYPS